MRRTIILILLGLSVGLNIAFTAGWFLHGPIAGHSGRLLQHSGHGGDFNKEAVWSDLHRRLDVSKEQWKELEPVMRRFHGNIRKHREKIRELRAEMFSALREDEVDREKVRDLQRRMRKAQAKVQDVVLEHILQEKKVLTDKQEEQFLQLLGERMQCGRRGAPMNGRGHGRSRQKHRGMR